jgi:hypothetical protein
MNALMLGTAGLSLYSATIYALDGAAQGRAAAGERTGIAPPPADVPAGASSSAPSPQSDQPQ